MVPDRTSDRLERWLGSTTFGPGSLRLGVSGGADSLALLALAAEVSDDVVAVHVDHGQRPESPDELAVVMAAAAAVGAEVESATVRVEPGPNLEARMRAARYEVLGPEAATGHTADDQAETVLVNLLRGSGMKGLGAMRPGPRRPILALRRSDTTAICATLGWAPVADPSNADPRHVRNRIRHELIPLLDDIAGRDVVPLLCRTADHARSVQDDVEDRAAELDPSDAIAVAAAPAPVAAAALAEWIKSTTAAEHPLDSAAIARVLAVAAGDRVAAEVSGGWRISRSGQRLSIS